VLKIDKILLTVTFYYDIVKLHCSDLQNGFVNTNSLKGTIRQKRVS